MTFRAPNQEGSTPEKPPVIEHIKSINDHYHQHSKHVHSSDDCCHDTDHAHLHHNTSSLFIHQTDFETFQTAVDAASRRPGFLAIVNVSRKALEQTGDGHFCPIGGFNSPAHKALLLDTARFKYPPHWVDLHLLYNSIQTIDPETNKSRGFIMLARKVTKAISKKIPPHLARQPQLEKLNLYELFQTYVETNLK